MSKIYNNIFEEIVSKENFDKAYKDSLKGKGKYNPDAMKFIADAPYNLLQLRKSLIEETYEHKGYIRFQIYEPKERIIDAPYYIDKIVQLAINNVLKKIYYPSFINDTYACINGRGTHKCVEKINHILKKAKWEYGEQAYIIKIDIKKFFYSIDREVLKKIISKKIKCKKTLRLLFKIIDSADVLDPLGLPLGNTLSQMFANVCLNELDQFCKRQLGIKYFIRYMDDIIIIVKNKTIAIEVLTLIEAFIKEKLHLNVNIDKTKKFPINQGVNAVGFKNFGTHKLLRDNSKKKIKRKIKAMPRLIKDKKLTVRKAEQMLNSWKGHAEHSDSYNFILSLVDKHDFLYINNKGRLKINTKKLEVQNEYN